MARTARGPAAEASEGDNTGDNDEDDDDDDTSSATSLCGAALRLGTASPAVSVGLVDFDLEDVGELLLGLEADESLLP